MSIPSNCVIKTRHVRIVCEEKASKITFINPLQQDILKITVDNCAITQGNRCDYLIIDHHKTEYYVELKGRGIDHAIEQLEATIPVLSIDKKASKWCFIISSRCPLLTTKIQELKLRFRKKYNATLIIKNRQYEHTL